MRVIYISSLGHSGSTFLELQLTKYSGTLAMGEIWQQLEALLNNKAGELPLCSCGKQVFDCEQWGKIVAAVASEEVTGPKELLQHFNSFSAKTVLIDSSKSPAFISHYSSLNSVQLQALFLVRDYRSWVLSVQGRNKRKGHPFQSKVFLAYKWLFLNWRNLKRLKKLKVEFQVVVYERVVFQYDQEMAAISTFAKLGDSSNEERNNFHDILGNRMKASARVNKIVYDSQWFSAWPFWLEVLCLPQRVFMKHIYSR